jgi:hypothetical protein
MSQKAQVAWTEAVTIQAMSVLFQEKEERGGSTPLLVFSLHVVSSTKLFMMP